MVPYVGTYGSRQRIYNKPICVGYKVWVLVTEAYQCAIKVQPYQGAKNCKRIATSTSWRLGEHVFLNLMECLTQLVNYHVFMDNYFTSVCLLTYQGDHGIRATGVLSKLKLKKCARKGTDEKGAWASHPENIKIEIPPELQLLGGMIIRESCLASNWLLSQPSWYVCRWDKNAREYGWNIIKLKYQPSKLDVHIYRHVPKQKIKWDEQISSIYFMLKGKSCHHLKFPNFDTI